MASTRSIPLICGMEGMIANIKEAIELHLETCCPMTVPVSSSHEVLTTTAEVAWIAFGEMPMM
jgi:hypothetical protein